MSSAEEIEHNEPSLSSKRSRQDEIQPGQDVFSVTLEHALSRQKDLFLQEIESRFGNVNTKKPEEGKFDFKKEGLKRQFLFNNDRLL
jgi:helix-turn-helix protein